MAGTGDRQAFRSDWNPSPSCSHRFQATAGLEALCSFSSLPTWSPSASSGHGMKGKTLKDPGQITKECIVPEKPHASPHPSPGSQAQRDLCSEDVCFGTHNAVVLGQYSQVWPSQPPCWQTSPCQDRTLAQVGCERHMQLLA